MAAKPKLSPEQWASTRATWEADPRKPLAWLIEELGLPVGAEALRLRAKSEGKKRTGMASNDGTTVAKPKLGKLEAGKPYKPRQTPINPYKYAIPHAGETAAHQEPGGPDLDVTKLPLRWQVLIEEYLIDLNGTQPAIRVGYSAKSACQIGTENLSKPSIRVANAPWAKRKPAVAAPAGGKVSQPPKVSQRNHGKVSQAPRETITETMPETIEGAGAGAQGADSGDGVLSKDEHKSYEQLTPRAQQFVGEYLIDLNAAAAYRRAYPDATEASARTLAARLLAKVGISEVIAAAQAERARRTEVNADKALSDVWAIATADTRELVQVEVEVDSCRCCHGESHQRQRTVGEVQASGGLPRPRTRFRKLGFDGFSKFAKPSKTSY